MSLRVILTRDAIRKIAAQKFTRAMVHEIRRKLTVELAASPDTLLGEAVLPYAHTRAYNFILGVRPCRIFFMFVVRRLPADDVLQVIGGRIIQEAAGRNGTSIIG